MAVSFKIATVHQQPTVESKRRRVTAEMQTALHLRTLFQGSRSVRQPKGLERAIILEVEVLNIHQE